MTYMEMFKREIGPAIRPWIMEKFQPLCPHHMGYEQYTVPIETNGCIHKGIDCLHCWKRNSIPFKIGDVVYADDGEMKDKGIIIENVGGDDNVSMLVVFSHATDVTHNGNGASINAPYGDYENNNFRYFHIDYLKLDPEGKIEDVMPLEEFTGLLKLGYGEDED